MRQINQQRTIEVQLLESSQVGSTKKLLVEALPAEDRETVSSSEAEAMVRFDTNRTDEQLAATLAQLIDRGAHIAQFREVPTDLEDAFLTVTRRDRQEAAR